MSTPPLNKHDLHIINSAMALLEAEVESDDAYNRSALEAVRRVRMRVFAHIDSKGGYNPDLGIHRH